MYGEGAVTDRTCQKWFARFHAGNFSLDDVPQLGRPVEVDSDQIETLAESDKCSTIWERAGILYQNTQIHKVIGENEKCVFYFMQKTKQTFWPTQCFAWKCRWQEV